MTAYRTTLLVALFGAALTQACSDSGDDIAAPDPIPTPVASSPSAVTWIHTLPSSGRPSAT